MLRYLNSFWIRFWVALRKKCPYSDLFWSVFSGPYFPAFGLNTDQNTSEYGHFLHSVDLINIAVDKTCRSVRSQGCHLILRSRNIQSYWKILSRFLVFTTRWSATWYFAPDERWPSFKGLSSNKYDFIFTSQVNLWIYNYP